MSRTYKDKDFYLRFPEEKWDYGYENVTQWWPRPLTPRGLKTKKSRRYKGDWKWYGSTPSWWINQFMTRPTRSACRNWAKQVIYSDNLIAEDCPDYGRKPHKYYW